MRLFIGKITPKFSFSLYWPLSKKMAWVASCTLVDTIHLFLAVFHDSVTFVKGVQLIKDQGDKMELESVSRQKLGTWALTHKLDTWRQFFIHPCKVGRWEKDPMWLWLKYQMRFQVRKKCLHNGERSTKATCSSWPSCKCEMTPWTWIPLDFSSSPVGLLTASSHCKVWPSREIISSSPTMETVGEHSGT